MTTLLRVLVCGSVDDGKSTLIGRLLHDTGSIPSDLMGGLQRDGALDLSLLTDGLEAEREQGITIDVAHRQFRTKSRRVLLLDCPGHEQYTRNMATGASGAEMAVVLVDAARGVQAQTRRHLSIARLMGIRHIVCVVNKMDLVAFDAARFEALAAGLPEAALVLPACARDGGGVTWPSRDMPWYGGPTLLEHLDEVSLPGEALGAFRMPVQWVSRVGGRMYAGTVAAGRIGLGDAIGLSEGPDTRVLRILGPAGEQDAAVAGDAVMVELADERDVGRGSVLSAADDPAPLTNQVEAHLVWCDEAPLLPGRAYLFKVGCRTVAGHISAIRHVIDAGSGLAVSAPELRLNDIAVVEVWLAGLVAFERFADCRALGGFIVIDRQTRATLGAGMIERALTGNADVRWHETQVSQDARSRLMGQRPMVVWLTGLSGAGKSTIANLLEALLHAQGRHTYLLDGDNLRHGLCRDLGFSAADRVENVRRVSEVAALMVDAGLIVLVCLIAPYRADRAAARGRLSEGAFMEVFIDAPVEECRRRDTKGLYRKADQGLIPDLTGVNAPYEAPTEPDIHIRSDVLPPMEAANIILEQIRVRSDSRAPGPVRLRPA